MKRIKFIYVLLVIMMMTAMSVELASCSKDNDEGSGDSAGNSKALVGSKWELKNWDYSIGDEYVGIHDEIVTVYFHSSTNGAIYHSRTDSYSDQGTSKSRAVAHFKYEVKGNEIELDYITDEILSISHFELSNGILQSGSAQFTKNDITASDYQWINTIQGTTGDCKWYSDLMGTLWIDGDGKMADYTSFSATPWYKADCVPNKVVINDGVTSIGNNAFANLSIAEIETPDKSLTRIGDGALKGSLITNIRLGENISYIGKEAFSGCKNLKQFSPSSLEKIEEIGEYAFYGCNLSIYEMSFGTELKSIGDFAFEGANVSELNFSEGVETIGNGAFLGTVCKISKELLLPNSLQSIGATAFKGSFNKIVIGTGLQELGEDAFITGSSGEMYVNLSEPPTTNGDVIVGGTNWTSYESGWTLYIPKGCKSAYAKKSPWSKFKSIVMDGSLEGDDAGDDEEQEDKSTGFTNGYEYVDLGLSVKWATCNLGASSPEKYGYYFAWGITKPNTRVRPNWQDYELSTGTSESCIDIGENISGTKYDAATAIMGKGWRMPTIEEWRELKKQCDYEWTSIEEIEGLKVIGPNGNSIFLPAGGEYSWLGYVDENKGDYWTSNHDYDGELCKSDVIRFYYYKNSVTFDVPHWQKGLRSNCCSIRPVTDK